METYRDMANKEHANSLYKTMDSLRNSGKAERTEAKKYTKEYMSSKPSETTSKPDEFSKGGKVIKRAMGGVAKMRLGEANSKGNPIKGGKK